MKSNRPIWTILAMLAASQSGTALAAQLSLSQAPPGTAIEPIPNIIVSVDDSGSMLAAGMTTLKSALAQTFASTNVADGRIRLAWQSMNTCRAISTNGGTPAGCGAFNGALPLEGSHRTNFLNWVANTLPAVPPNSNLTPSHQMMQRAGEYLRTTGQWSPWRTTPGSTTDTTEQSCRKAFNIFMTDGAWNTYQAAPYADGSGISVGGGNADGTAKVLPDGTAYDVSAANTQTRLYRDTWGFPALSTLSDVAFHYWSTDLQPGLTNNVSFQQKVTVPETVGTTALQPYWNPKNNPATWQHMTTYSIGFNAHLDRQPGVDRRQLWWGRLHGHCGWRQYLGQPPVQRGCASRHWAWQSVLHAGGVPCRRAQPMGRSRRPSLFRVVAHGAKQPRALCPGSQRAGTGRRIQGHPRRNSGRLCKTLGEHRKQFEQIAQ